MKTLILFTLLVLLMPAAMAQSETLTIDPARSDVKMTLNTNHEVVHGTFHVQSGAIRFDRTAHRISGSIVVAAGSGQTGNGTRDKRMNKEVLKTEQYTTVTFEPKSYTGTIPANGDATLQVTGSFTLLGTPHELTLPLVIHCEGSAVTAKAHFSVPYVQWGLKDPSLFIWKADKQVDLDLSLNGQLAR
jgi:polyisoprenoid-binding protein YceI